jgi:hypothetical protein
MQPVVFQNLIDDKSGDFRTLPGRCGDQDTLTR